MTKLIRCGSGSAFLALVNDINVIANVKFSSVAVIWIPINKTKEYFVGKKQIGYNNQISLFYIITFKWFWRLLSYQFLNLFVKLVRNEMCFADIYVKYCRDIDNTFNYKTTIWMNEEVSHLVEKDRAPFSVPINIGKS